MKKCPRNRGNFNFNFNFNLNFNFNSRVRRRVTGCGAASVKSPDFQAVDIVLGNLKTTVSGTHHAVGFAKYSPRYLAQVQHLINRRFNLQIILPRLIYASCATTARPMWLKRGVEHSC